ncbi:MAG: AraC family transcriptional regulator [Pseudomonadota bacterium]|jgi:AraC-like DNA-binding protein
MDAQQLDVAIRIAGVTVLLFLAFLLARDGKGGRQAVLFVPLAICISGFLIGNTADPSLRPDGVVGRVAHLLSGYAAIFIWWFCLACFDRHFRLRGPILAVGILWICIASADRGVLGSGVADKGLSRLLVAFGLGIVAHLGWRLLHDREGDFVETRRDARVIVVILLGGQLLADFLVDALLGFDWRPRVFAISQNAAILAFGLWLATRLLRADPGTLTFPASTMQVVPVVETGDARLAERLRNLIEVERVHLDPDLSFATFVRKMGAAERAVRQLVNHELGHDHFRSFINAYRVEEACRLLSDSSRAGDKLIAIAMDSGFASLASFNRVFRAARGCTPGAYRAASGHVPISSSPAPTAKPSFEERSAAF